MKDWSKFLKETLKQAISEKDIYVDGYIQTNYYNDNLDIIVERSKIGNNEYTYDVNKYKYDEMGRCSSILKYSEGTAICFEKYIYENSLLKRIENYVIDDDTTDESPVPYVLNTIHHFFYVEGVLQEEKVCLASGEVSYFKQNHNGVEVILNPFHTSLVWKIDSIEEKTICVSVLEKTFTCTVFTEIIKKLKNKYSFCTWIIIDSYSTYCPKDESEKMSNLIVEFEKMYGIQIDFG